MCFENVVKSFENLEYVKSPPPWRYYKFYFGSVFHNGGGGGESIGRPTHLMHVVHMGGLDQTIGFK
jgi:hypothetical protein